MPNTASRISGRRLAGVVSALTLTAAASLVQAGAASAAGRVVHQATAGTPDACEAVLGTHPGCDGNYSWTAREYADGSVSGEYTDRFAGGFGVHGVIDCLAVDDNQAWVSGRITGGFLAGQYFLSSALDNGTSANDPADQVGLTTISEEPLDCATMPDVVLSDAPDGQVTVR